MLQTEDRRTGLPVRLRGVSQLHSTQPNNSNLQLTHLMRFFLRLFQPGMLFHTQAVAEADSLQSLDVFKRHMSRHLQF